MTKATEAKTDKENAPQAASLNTVLQFVKHFSFDNKHGREALAPTNLAPQIAISVNINLNKIDDTNYEVDLVLNGGAKTTERELFSFNLTYSSIMEAKNLLPAQIHPVMMIDAPRLMFPFARAIIAEEVRNGGFPPLYIEPIDFLALYRQKLEEVAGKKIMQ